MLRYVLDHPNATSKHAAADLHMSFPNVCRLVAAFKSCGILVDGEQQQTGRRGPWSQSVTLRKNLGCTVGVDLEATHVRGVILDFANNLTGALREPIPPTAGTEEIVSAVTELAGALMRLAREQKLRVGAVGLALPGPILDGPLGRIRTDLQFGEATLEFVPTLRQVCPVPITATANAFCFAAGHHRMRNPRDSGIEVVILNRFGISATVVWDGRLYTGASQYAGDLGLLPCPTVSPIRRYQDVCTGSALLRLGRIRGDGRPFQELIRDVSDPLVQEWLGEALPALVQVIYAAVVAYNPHRVIIEGIFNRFPEEVRRQIVEAATRDLESATNMMPEIQFFTGDDLMGARGAALLARDGIAEAAIAQIIRNSTVMS